MSMQFQHRRMLAGLIAGVLLVLGIMTVTPRTAVTKPFSCSTYGVSISGGTPPAPGLGVAVDFQFISTPNHQYTADGSYTESSSTSSGPAIDALISIPGCGSFTVPADGLPHKVGLTSCSFCYNVTVGTNFLGCTLITITRVAC